MKGNKEHTVPLTKQALELLNEMKPISGHREYVWPGDRNPKSHMSPSTTNMALKRMQYGGRTCAHGFRSIASTVLNEQTFDPDVIEAALSHVNRNEVRAAYNRSDYLEHRRKMMQWWSDHIQESTIKGISQIGKP